MNAKSNEIPAFTPLLDAVERLLGSLHGLIFVADALHTQVGHANEIAARGAHLLIPAKGNQPRLFAQLKTLPWAQVPIGHQTRDAGHGRRETRTVKAIALHTPGRIGFPHAQQAIRISRTRTAISSGKTTRETAYLTISLPSSDAQPAEIPATTVFSQRSMRRFGASHRRATPKGLPSSSVQHRFQDPTYRTSFTLRAHYVTLIAAQDPY